jgi:AraC-like DNA-binding protein
LNDSDSGAAARSSFLDFYESKYWSYIHCTGRIGTVSMVHALQTPGDFSDDATEDTVIMRSASRGRFITDFSAGVRQEWWSPGDWAFVPARWGTLVRAEHYLSFEAASFAWGRLRAIDVEERLAGDGGFEVLYLRQNGAPALNRLFEALWSASRTHADALTAESALVAIYDHAVAYDRLCRPAARVVERVSARALRLSFERLSDVGAEPAWLGELAALAWLSPSHFCRAFKAETGLPPHRWQRAQRIERAREMLSTTRLSVAEVGAALGFADPANLSRLSAHETGVAPSVWRQERRKQPRENGRSVVFSPDPARARGRRSGRQESFMKQRSI